MSDLESITDTILWQDTLEIQGLVFRGFEGKSDYPHILALINAAKREDGVERSDTLEDVQRYYEHLHHCDPHEDMLFAEVDGEVVAYSRVEWNLNKDGEWLGFHINFMHPDWRRQRIGSAMLRWNEARLREIAARQLQAGEIQNTTPLYFEVYAADGETGKHALLDAHGYDSVRHEYAMLCSLSEPIKVTPLPDGLELRRGRREQSRQIWDAAQEAFRDHWNYIPEPEEEYQRWLKGPEFDPSLWKVAWEGDEVCGMVLNFVNENENEEYQRQRGYTEAISVRRPWRRRGLARALLTRSLQMFKDMGMTEAALGVDAQNTSGALRLYESVGFQVEKHDTIYRKRFETANSR
jgi:mycothiol synthase